jgi:uncharacterized membrane protein
MGVVGLLGMFAGWNALSQAAFVFQETAAIVMLGMGAVVLGISLVGAIAYELGNAVLPN